MQSKPPVILVVDDEPTILGTVRAYLEREGYTVHTALDGPTALKAARALRPHLIVLDLMLPGMDGLEVLQHLRHDPSRSDVYVLMLTARADETDKVVGLTLGADDYLTKPFSPRELVARVKAILRRDRGVGSGEPILAFANVRIEPDSRRVWKDDELLDLTPVEFDLLHALAQHRGRVLSREQLIEQVWGYEYYGDDRVVDVHIGRLRKKIESHPANLTAILTVRGVGYRFEGESA